MPNAAVAVDFKCAWGPRKCPDYAIRSPDFNTSCYSNEFAQGKSSYEREYQTVEESNVTFQ